jgi:hypothetical protein
MENPLLPPWECIDPALTAERLAAIAAIIRDETDAKLKTRDPRDGNWNIGCDCHAWVLRRFHAVSEAEYADWLFVESAKGDLDLEFRVGDKHGTRVKIYQPKAAGQPGRTLRQPNEELLVIQQTLGAEFDAAPDPVVRVAFEKNEDGGIATVQLVQLDLEGNVTYVWTIWSADADITDIGDVARPEGKQLDEPDVSLPEDDEDEDEDENKRDSEGGA